MTGTIGRIEEVGDGRVVALPRRTVSRQTRVGRAAAKFQPSGRELVSVVIPCFNYAQYLPDAVGSVLTQEGVQIEVIVVDDASSDSSLDVAMNLAALDDRVTVLSNEANCGPVETFNKGLARVTGEYIVRLDADDLLTPQSLARSVAVARAFPTVGLVYGHPVHFSGAVPRDCRRHVRSWTIWPGPVWLRDRCRSGHNVITSPEVLMRASVVALVGGQRNLQHTHDMEMWLRIATHSDVAYIQGPDQAWHREHPGSLSEGAISRYGIRILEEKFAAFEKLFQGRTDSNDYRSACMALASEAIKRACHEIDRNRFDPDGVNDLVKLSLKNCGQVREAPGWRALSRRMPKQPDGKARRPWLALPAVMRRALTEVRYRHWARHGTYEHSLTLEIIDKYRKARWGRVEPNDLRPRLQAHSRRGQGKAWSQGDQEARPHSVGRRVKTPQ